MVESIKKSIKDYECPICYEICVEPVITPCRHFFCLVCQKDIIKRGLCCPLCRRNFDKMFTPKIDKGLQSEIYQNFSLEFQARKFELE